MLKLECCKPQNCRGFQCFLGLWHLFKLFVGHKQALIMTTVRLIVKCFLVSCPSYVAAAAVKANIFDVALKTNIFGAGSNSSSR